MPSALILRRMWIHVEAKNLVYLKYLKWFRFTQRTFITLLSNAIQESDLPLFIKIICTTPAKIPDGIKQDAQFVQVKEVMPLDWT